MGGGIEYTRVVVILIISIICFVFPQIVFTADSADCETNSCGDCTKSLSCVWCNTEQKCTQGNFWGPKSSNGCGGWRWEQCTTSGYVPFLISVSVVGLIFLIALFCVCRCFLFQRRRKSMYSDYIRYTESSDEKAPNTMLRREEMSKKYGFSSGKNSRPINAFDIE